MSGKIQRGPEYEPFVGASRTQWLLASGAFLVFLFLSIAYSLTRSPWWDEGLFADIALNFRNFSHLGSTVLDPNGWLELPDVHRYTYWHFPLYPMSLGYWFRLVPATVVWMRLFSVLWGCVFVISWFVVVRSLTRKEPLALLVASVVALDYVSVLKASDGRMDMMCAALGLAGLASYFWFRDSNWSLGVVIASWFGAASFFCHPMGVVTSAWLAAMVLLDWRRIRWGAVMAASIPYLIGLAGCLYYIYQAPDVFLVQSKAASGYRVSGWGAILGNILNDAYKRYIRYYCLGYAGISNLKIVSLIFPVAGVVGLLADRNLRSQALGKRLLLLAFITYVGIAVIDNQKLDNYYIYSMPFLTACGAVWVYGRRTGSLGRLLASSLLGASILVTVGAFLYRTYMDEYHNLYNPTIAAVRSSLPPGGIVMGGSELGFALGFGPPLVDDQYLGSFSGKTPDVFVVNGEYSWLWPALSQSPRLTRAWKSSRKILQSQYHLTFTNKLFSVYVRNNTSAVRQSGK